MQEQVLYKTEKHPGYGVELVDAHCHLDLFDDPKIAISDAGMAGVKRIITAGGSRASSMAAAKLADGKNVFAVIGVDPEGAKADSGFVGEIERIVKSNKGVIGIGEIGLDNKIGTDKALQKKVLEEQIGIANALDLPIVIHSRQAIDEVIEIVKALEVRKAMFHYFEGDEKQAKVLADLGYLISIPPVESSKRKRAISAVDLSSLAVETDSPVVGKSPIDVINTVRYIAKIKGLSFEEAAAGTTQNVKKLFHI